MNTYFQEALMVVQSEQFGDEFKSTVKFILRLINLLFLVIAGLFTLIKGFLCRQPKPKQLVQAIEDNDEVINGDSSEVVNKVGTLEEEVTSDSSLENQTETDLTEVNSTQLDKGSRYKELKLMKAAELRLLCGAYSIGYKNKLAAIESILDLEYSYDGIPF